MWYLFTNQVNTDILKQGASVLAYFCYNINVMEEVFISHVSFPKNRQMKRKVTASPRTQKRFIKGSLFLFLVVCIYKCTIVSVIGTSIASESSEKTVKNTSLRKKMIFSKGCNKRLNIKITSLE